MMQCFTSIYCSDGLAHNLAYHQARIQHYLQVANTTANAQAFDLSAHLPDIPMQGEHKLRIEFNEQGIQHTSCKPYHRRTIEALMIVDAEDLSYNLKYCDRSHINALVDRHCKHAEQDIIICKQGLVQDTSYSNLCFYDGTTWFTPIQPLLPGTMRAMLIEENKIIERAIAIEDVQQYQLVCLINACNPLGKIVLPTSCIRKH
ncbi:MAG: hypothetical protein RL660_2541 [Bacteroidota bacterium]|jgi:4-amino-4-deoxychorismate lyase